MYPSISLLLQTFMMLTLHSLNGVNNTVSWFCSRFRLEKFGYENLMNIFLPYILICVVETIQRMRSSSYDGYIESVHH